MAGTDFFPLAAAHQNLRRLLFIRIIVFFCQLLALGYSWYYLRLSLNYSAIVATLIIFVLINMAVLFRLARVWPIGDPEFFLHLLLDVAGLSVLLYFSGGANNPFVSYYLVPITIAAAILPWLHTWLIALACLVCYTALLFFYQPLPELMPMEMAVNINMDMSSIPSLHILGMWFNFLVSAALITYFVVKMAAEIRHKEARLNRYREDNLRDEHILAVATQAAGTAHELGTPINTVSVLVREMQSQYPDHPDLQKELSLIDQQLQRCKSSLKALVNQADFKKTGGIKALPLKEFIQHLLEQWQLIRPEISLTVSQPDTQAPVVFTDSTLQQAIVNILNNAADASPQGIGINVFWDERDWGVDIRDYGEGINEEIREQLGTAFISTKESGLGVGLLLSQASINRLGGTVSIHPHEAGGTLTKISLPLKVQDSA